jgi:peptidoglycan/xylan/chitin deacetylase (PgdA/CDA1 family)
VDESDEQKRMGASEYSVEASSDAYGQGNETLQRVPIEEDAIAGMGSRERPASDDGGIAGLAGDESLHAQITDLSLIAIGDVPAGGAATTQAPRERALRRIRLAFPRGRLALLGPLAAALLIVGVVLSGLGLQGKNIADIITAPFGASRPHATATVAPPSNATSVVNASAPRPRVVRDHMRDWNAAVGCAGGAPPALAKPIYTSKNFAAGAPPPNEVALTFDDGPTPYTTPPILDYLEQNHVPATFFVEGLYARVWPYLVQREWNSGFAIGMHSWDHPVLTILPNSQMPHQFGESLDAIHAAIGKDACVWFWRPPYGSYDPRILGVAQSYQLTTVMWDDDSVDYSRPGPDHIAATVLSEAHPGAVILMHDGPARREQTLAALPLILAGLKARGLKPVTLPQLLADSRYPGVDVTKPPLRDKPDPTT